MKITIINGERTEKRYTRVELDDFVAQLRDGTYRLENTSRDSRKEVCFVAEWQKYQGELQVRNDNRLVLLSLENLRDLATVREYKEMAMRCTSSVPTTLPTMLHKVSKTLSRQHPILNVSSMLSRNCTTSIPRS